MEEDPGVLLPLPPPLLPLLVLNDDWWFVPEKGTETEFFKELLRINSLVVVDDGPTIGLWKDNDLGLCN